MRLSDEIVEVAGSVGDAHDPDAVIGGTIEDQMCAIRE